ncbi:rod shape-determining protein MreD [Lentibacillus halophilus]|uniref:Rod shape-determining protein MreD n=1 Tax=Lentibacillus halophilus TaxID=295065 RepID=A0ABN0ZC68_9BACI
MRRIVIPILLFLLLVLEGVALDLLPASLVRHEWQLVPHWVLIFLTLKIMLFDKEDTNISVIHGLIFGLLIDVVYTGILGVYMFSYGIVVYLLYGLSRLLHANVYTTILLSVIGVAVADMVINILFSASGITDLIWGQYLLYRMLPTVLANVFFLLVLYPLLAKWLEKWKAERFSKSSAYF